MAFLCFAWPFCELQSQAFPKPEAINLGNSWLGCNYFCSPTFEHLEPSALCFCFTELKNYA